MSNENPGKPSLPNYAGMLRVVIIDDESDRIPEVLGLDPEREKELDELTELCMKNCKTITDTIAEISKSIKHANELAYCVFHVGANVGRSKTEAEQLGGLLGLLGKLKGQNDE